MSALICKECKEGTLRWVDFDKWTSDVSDLDTDMECNNCGHVYHGMDDFLNEEQDNA